MIRRIVDIGLAATALLVLSPLLVAIAVAIRLDSEGPVLFRHRRVGRHHREFDVLKFRTMAHGGQIHDGMFGPQSSTTRVGRLLRRTKLDELPQLLNVLDGSMSLVGPRPEIGRYVEMFPDVYRSLLQVRPGLTDPAALRFFDEDDLLADAVDPERLYVETILPAKLELSVDYLANRSLRSDVTTLAKTLRRLRRPEAALDVG